jgi:DNA-binding NarL/FixJ family response regulator
MCHELGRRRRHFKVVACAHTSKELLERVSEHKPGVALISSDLPGESNGGLKALQGLRASGSPTRPVILVDSSVPELVVSAFATGARGVICMREPIAVLCKCIQSVQAGRIWADSDQLEWIVENLMARLPFQVVNAKGEPLLTKREEQIVRMIAEGLPNNEISSNLEMSPHTVKNHLFRIYEKLGISNRVELLLYTLSGR